MRTIQARIPALQRHEAVATLDQIATRARVTYATSFRPLCRQQGYVMLMGTTTMSPHSGEAACGRLKQCAARRHVLSGQITRHFAPCGPGITPNIERPWDFACSIISPSVRHCFVHA